MCNGDYKSYTFLEVSFFQFTPTSTWLSFLESFGLILLNSKFICVTGTVPTYLGEWGERVNLGNTVTEIQQKYEREREKEGERECMNFGNVITEIPAVRLACPSVCVVCSK